MTTDPIAAVAAKFVAVNGRHPMTAADDAYVDEFFVPLGRVCEDRPESADEVREHMLAGRLPLPGYLRSTGEEMVPPDYFALADTAGGPGRLHTWFLAQWPDPDLAAAEWQGYVDGHYICLRTTDPAVMKRKDDLIARIKDATAELGGTTPEPEQVKRLHALVDELDDVLAGFAAYDRLRFGGPISRDVHVTEVRARYPIGDARPLTT